MNIINGNQSKLSSSYQYLTKEVSSKRIKEDTSFKHAEEDTSSKYFEKDLSLVKSDSHEDVIMKNEIRSFEATEKSIINHEKMHMMIGGNLAGSPSFIYTTGPDGRRYVSGGQVNLKMPSGGTLTSLLRNLKRIKSAATAVSNPSAADISTASSAATLEASVNREIALSKMKETYKSSSEIQTKNDSFFNEDVLEKMIKSTYTTKLSQMNYKTFSKFELLV